MQKAESLKNESSEGNSVGTPEEASIALRSNDDGEASVTPDKKSRRSEKLKLFRNDTTDSFRICSYSNIAWSMSKRFSQAQLVKQKC